MRNRRGSVLLQVIVTATLVALISVTLMRLSLMRSTAAARGAKDEQGKRYDQAALALLTSTWSSTNGYCTSVAGIYTCTTPGSTTPPITNCVCTCTPTAAYTATYPQVNGTLLSAGPPMTCTLTIQGVDL